MSFISKEDLLSALTILVEEGFNTTETSSLVYFFALSKILKEKKQPWVSLNHGAAERDEFIANVKDLIEINEDYIWHPIGSSDSMDTSWNKRKNVSSFVSSNLLTTSYGRREETYPKRSPLLSFSDGKATLYSDYQKNLDNTFAKYSDEVLRATCIWILRTHNFQSSTVTTKQLIDEVSRVYGFDIDIRNIDDFSNVISSSEQINSLEILLKLANERPKNIRTVEGKKIPYSFNTHPLSKPFLLLAGISGTGKTRFVREQAKATGSVSETYCLTPVRPDWHEPSDILGYTSRLSGSSEYVTTEVLQFIAKAWRAIIDVNGLKLEAITTNKGDTKLIVKGDKDQLDNIPPYWLCLDEMNLAPVEQYFADYLSILETREWSWDGDAFDYSCDSLLSASIIEQVSKPEVLREDLGFAEVQYDEQWALFCKYGMSIPFNLLVAGTVNMDETTHGFSRKVIDRALSFDFGEFFPNDFDQFFSPTVRNKVLSYPIHSQATIDKLPEIDNDGSKSIAFLNAINTVLGNTPFELAYRALNELLLAVISSQPADDIELQAVWDDFLMCKVLPRIEGDQDKLMVINEVTQDITSESLLSQLTKVLEVKLDTIWDKSLTKAKTRPDLFREKMQGDKTLHISCRSQAKIAWMQTRLVRSSFTSFWP